MNTLTFVAFSVGVFAGILLLLEVGHRSGRRARARRPADREGTETIEAAVFALLGLLLAFTFSGATSRLDVRRHLVIEEANAIGTAYLRLDMLPAEDQVELRRLFRLYVDARRRVYNTLPDLASARRAHAEASDLQRQIWTAAVDAARRDATDRAALFVLPAINALIDVASQRSITSATHVAPPVFLHLIVVAFCSAVLAGHAMGRRGTRPWLQILVYAGVVSVTIFVLLDLEYPRAGLIRVGAADETLRLLQESIGP